LNEVLLSACKELIDDAKLGCADMVFKDICLEILAKAKLVLSPEQFEELSFYTAERLKEGLIPNLEKKIRI
jgi:dsDNA-binding SOS-regulon protein